MKKRIISFIVVLALILSLMPISVFAYDSGSREIRIKVDPEIEVTVVISLNLLNDVSEAEIADLVRCLDLTNDDRVTILDVGYANQEPLVQPRSLSYRTTILGYGSTEYKVQNFFVISVAKGMTEKLETEFTKTVTTGFGTGSNAPYVSSSISKSVTAKYDVTFNFSGPPESSEYNSREFRVQFYAHDIYWQQDKLSPSGGVVETRSGTGAEPTKYLLYSLDHKLT